MDPEPRLSEIPELILAGDEQTRELYIAVLQAVKRLGKLGVRVGKSQIAFWRRRSFAAVWVPGQYLRGKTAPLVLTLYLPFRHPSARFKQIVEPAEGRFTHHLELWEPADVDDEVLGWLSQAWEAAA
jgi:hypothetical protein